MGVFKSFNVGDLVLVDSHYYINDIKKQCIYYNKNPRSSSYKNSIIKLSYPTFGIIVDLLDSTAYKKPYDYVQIELCNNRVRFWEPIEWYNKLMYITKVNE